MLSFCFFSPAPLTILMGSMWICMRYACDELIMLLGTGVSMCLIILTRHCLMLNVSPNCVNSRFYATIFYHAFELFFRLLYKTILSGK